MVAIVLLITAALVAVTVGTIRVASPRPPERQPSRPLESSSPPSADKSRFDLSKGLLLGLLVSPAVGVSVVLGVFSMPTFTIVALPAWGLGPYAYALVAALRGSRSRAWSAGLAIGHSIAIAVLWLAAVKFFAGLDVGIGGG